MIPRLRLARPDRRWCQGH